MPNHDDHHCECKHTDVAFCVKCDLVYCKGCKREWQNPCMLAHSWPIYTSITTQTSDPWTYVPTTGDTICDHSTDSVSGELVLDAVGGPHTHSGG